MPGLWGDQQCEAQCPGTRNFCTDCQYDPRRKRWINTTTGLASDCPQYWKPSRTTPGVVDLFGICIEGYET